MGPFQNKFVTTLDNMNLKRQVYHSGAVVGNDIHTIMKKKNMKIINTCFKPIQIIHHSNQQVFISSHTLKQKLLTFHSKIRDIFELISLNRPMCQHEVSYLSVRCYSFVNWLPVSFPDINLIRKFHVAVTHVPEKASRVGTVGMESENFIESIHPVVNKLKKMFATVQNQQQQLSLICQQQWLHSDGYIPDYRKNQLK